MFDGFSYDTITFLKGLEQNNNKAWFEANRENYEKYLLDKFKELVMELTPYMLELDPLFEVNPRRSISRIHRDIRFSKDKSHYRANMWLSFKRMYLDWKMEPTFFFELAPTAYRYGMGFYNVPRETLDKLRELIIEKDEEFVGIHTAYKNQNTFRIEGEVYKRPLGGSVDKEFLDWFQRKEIYFVCDRAIDETLMSRKLVEELLEGFKTLTPIYKFFLKLRDKQLI